MNRLHLCRLLLGGTLLAGCSGVDRLVRPSDPWEALRFDIERILGDSIFVPTRASVKIVSLDRDEVLYERDSRLLMRPASNMKLLTSAAALHILGTDYSFQTGVLADSIDEKGTVHGNLYLKGYGNPDLTTADLDTLVSRLRGAGIRKVTGNIVGDASFYDDRYWGEGWMWDDEPYSYEAGISALSLNKNCVRVSVVPGASHGDSVSVSVEPTTRYVSLLNTARTVTDSVAEPLEISRLYVNRLNIITVTGETLAGPDTVEQLVTVWRPELYAATVFKERLEADSIAVSGQAAPGAALPWSRELARIRWPIDTMLINLNKVSDNLSAENTLKAISAKRGGIPGSARHGLSQLHLVLDSMGIDTTLYYVVDGSGVSHYNLVTAEMLIRLLAGMARNSELFPLFYESLPIAGVDGTLKGRMNGTTAQGNLRAKTGSISGVSSLSGYVTTLDRERFAFSILMQNFILPSRWYRNAQDAIGALLANFSRTGRTMVSR